MSLLPAWHTLQLASGCCRKCSCTQSTYVAGGVPESCWKCTFLLQFSSSLPPCHEIMRRVLKVPTCTVLLTGGDVVWLMNQSLHFTLSGKQGSPFRKHFTVRDLDWVTLCTSKACKPCFQRSSLPAETSTQSRSGRLTEQTHHSSTAPLSSPASSSAHIKFHQPLSHILGNSLPLRKAHSPFKK